MSFKDLIEMCFRNLFRRRTRTLLAIVGVVVGTCAVILMLSVGFGLSESFREELQNYGNLHMITLYSQSMGGSNNSQNNDKGVISDKTLANIEKMDGVDAVTPVVSQYMYIQIGKYVTSAQIKGVKPEVLSKFGYEIDRGRMLEDGDKDMLLFGAYIPEWFYNPSSKNWDSKAQDVITDKMILTADWSIGQKLSPDQKKDIPNYEQYKVRGIGLLAVTGDYNADYSVFMNIKRLEEIQKDTQKAEKTRTTTNPSATKTYNQAMVYVGDLDKVEKVYNDLQDMGYGCDSPIAWLAEFNKIAKMIEMILGGIGGISLFVAALSIANTMIMSIYERTKEIGVMKVIGANLRDIKRMFLVEAGMIGFLGGAVGVALSLLLSLLMNTVLKGILSAVLSGLGGGSVISVIPLWLVFAALGFATLIGVVAGYYPAKRAMNLSALDSLRNE